jgi:hypothetical protein
VGCGTSATDAEIINPGDQGLASKGFVVVAGE